MGKSVLRIVKWLGVCLGAVVLLAAGLGVYLYLQIPKPVDPLPPLQTWLFEAPANHADQIAGRYVFRSAQELAELIRTRKATSEAVVAEHLAYIRAENHRLNALVWLRADEALAEARAADAAVASGAVLGPLHGVPITIKEMFGVRGLPETLNAKALTLIAREDAPLVAALRRAGAIVLGTTNVPYMLADYQTSGEIYPTGSNPYDVTRTPGGSTGGGAAAVAAGFSTLELGSDMGGSVRVPAAFCGLWALKATVGALNITQGTNPMPSLAFTRMALASPGLLARTAGDLALAWGALKTAPIDPAFQQPITWQPASAKSLGDYRLAWSDDWGSAHGPIPVSRSVRGRLQSFVTAVASQGAKVDRTSPPLYDDLLRNFLTSFSLMNAEGQPWLLRKLIAMDLRKLAPTAEMAQTIDRALADGSDAAWQAAQADRERLARAWDTFFRDHDLLISPITYGPAFTKTTTGAPLDGDDGPVPYLMYEAYAPVVNAVGFPTLSIPMGLDDRGLPIGLQVIGPRLSEEELLHFAALVEGLVGGYARPPAFGPRK